MDVLGSLDFKGVGKLKRARLAGSAFPADATEGEFVFANKRAYICINVIDGLPFWVPITNELNTVRFGQPTPALEWSVQHNLGGNLVTIQVYDADGKQVIPDEIDCSRANTAVVKFITPTSGFAVVMYGSDGVGVPQEKIAYEQDFTNQAVWVVSHGLGYNPAITAIIDNYVVQPQSIVHDSLMQTTVTFSSAQTGSVRCV